MTTKKLDMILGIGWTIIFMLDLVWYYNGNTPSRLATLIPTALLAAKYITSGLS